MTKKQETPTLSSKDVLVERRNRAIPVGDKHMETMPALSKAIGSYIVTGEISDKLDLLLEHCDANHIPSVREDSVLVGMRNGLSHDDYPKSSDMSERLDRVRVLYRTGRMSAKLTSQQSNLKLPKLDRAQLCSDHLVQQML